MACFLIFRPESLPTCGHDARLAKGAQKSLAQGPAKRSRKERLNVGKNSIYLNYLSVKYLATEVKGQDATFSWL